MRSASNLIFNSLSGLLLTLNLAGPVLAQGYNDNFDPARSNVTLIPPGSSPSQGLFPPPGHGGPNNVATVTPGDQAGTNPPVPTGSANTSPQYGSYFDHQSQSFRSRVNLLVNRGSQTVNGVSVNRGTRVALTFQPDQLTNSQQGQVEGLLGLGSEGLFSTEPYQNITVSTSTLEEIEKVLYPPAQPGGTTTPYPGTPVEGDTIRNTPWSERSYIDSDEPAQGHPRYQSRDISTVKTALNLPIREFCYYLVIAGVVIACMYLVFVGGMMAFGHPYSGSKAIAAAGGLMLLLMAYTIWKIDIFNALQARGQPQGANAPDSFNINAPPLSATEQVTGSHTYVGDNTLSEDEKSAANQDPTHPDAKLPEIPAQGTGQVEPRSGLPLLPLGSRH